MNRFGNASLFMLLLFATLSFSVIIESGDNGKQFSSDISQSKCREAGVKAVYVCNGNIVKVVSNQASEGSTFYKPDGRVVKCPDVPPSQMGGECVQLFTPNLCPSQSTCGPSVQTTFPGQQNTTAPREVVPVVVPTTPPTRNQTIINTQNKTTVNESIPNVGEEITETRPKTTKVVDGSADNLIWVIAGLGLVTVVVLFFLFRNTLKE